MKHRRGQHGFALLLTLVLVMIAGVALAAVARQSAAEALEAIEQTEQLQRRWATTSCRATLLPRAQGILTKANLGPVDEEGEPIPGAPWPDPTSAVWRRCELAGIAYDLVFTDEQAKYNPGTMQQFIKKRSVRADVRSLTESAASRANGEARVVFRSMVGLHADGTAIEQAAPDEEVPELYAGYGQLFGDTSPSVLLGEEGRPGPAMFVTCWSDGRLILGRSPRPAAYRVLKPVLGVEGTRELLAARVKDPYLSPSEWLRSVTEAEPQQLYMASLIVSERSESQGLWVVARGKTRSWYSFSVRQYAPPIEEEQATEAPADKGSNPPAKPADEGAEGSETEPAYEPYRRYDFSW